MAKLIVIAAPSGAGKTSLIKALLEETKELKFTLSISYTTREKRVTEKHGESYFFISNKEFELMIKGKEFLEYADVFGDLKGTSKSWVENKIKKGWNVILELDWQGASQIKEIYANSKTIFILPPSYTDLKTRLSKFLILEPIEKIDNIFNNLRQNLKIGFDYKNTSYFFYNLALENNHTPSNLQNPCLIPKAIKNETELEGSRKAHIRDGVSITKFLCWLKNHQSVEIENEISAANKLLSFRESNDLFHSISFESISAIGKNAALPHYRADKNNPVALKNNSIYLSDSGGQYYDGTTDITRTIILGKPDREQIDRFTRVLKGHINLSTHIFSKGTKGTDIDYLARRSLQEIDCDYDHGTGHGIGSFLSVHEAPQRISKKTMFESVELLPGMILSNEPGYYKEGEYGIRIENIVVVQDYKENKLKFENISWAPIDRDLINPNMLNDNELVWINEYHQEVYEKLSNFLTLEEKRWLQEVTMPLKL